MQEFRVNNYISLKLENKKTIIYVDNEKFKQCKYLLLKIVVEEMQSFNDIESIDEVAERLDKTLEGDGLKQIKIPPEVEFWGHCSNLQVWSENNYNTRLLHSNIAFPLLKKLYLLGDLIAKKVFREEIVKRIENGNSQVTMYLVEEEYINHLDRDEFLFSLLNHNDAEIMHDLENQFNMIFDVTFCIEHDKPNTMVIEDKNVIGLNFSTKEISNEIEKVILSLSKLSNLISLSIENSNLKHLPPSIGELKDLQFLNLCNNQIPKIPCTICCLDNLIDLNLENNILHEAPENLLNLNKLVNLNLRKNKISKISESIGKIKNLRYIYLNENLLTNPKEIRQMLIKKNRFLNIKL